MWKKLSIILCSLVIALPLLAGKSARDEKTAKRVASLTAIRSEGDLVVISLGDGSELRAPAQRVRLQDKRFNPQPQRKRYSLRVEREIGSKTPSVDDVSRWVASSAAGQAVLIKVRYDKDGSIKKLKLHLHASALAAQRELERHPAKE